MEINIGRDGIRNTDEASALIYYGRYPVRSWAELFYAAVKTLYIEYPEVINSLVSKDSTKTLYLRTTTIDMKKPARIATILYLDTARTPLEIVKALREIFRRAGVLNINMSIEIRRISTTLDINNDLQPQFMQSSIIQNPKFTQINKINIPAQISQMPIIQSSQYNQINNSNVKSNVPVQISQPPIIQSPQFNQIKISNTPPPIPKPSLDVPSFMKNNADSIRKVSIKELYIESMKNLVRKYPSIMKKEAGKFFNKRRVTLAESTYRYFIDAVEIGEGLSIEMLYNEEDLKKNLEYYLKLTKEI